MTFMILIRETGRKDLVESLNVKSVEATLTG